MDWLCPSRSSGSFCFSGLQDCISERELKSCWNQIEKSCVQRYFIVWSSLNLFELFLQLLQWLLSFSESFSGGTTKLWKTRNKMQQQPLNIKFIAARWLSACGRGDWSRKWKLTRDSGVTSSRWLLMLCGVGIPTVKVSYPILQQHFSLYENTGNGWDGEMPASGCNSALLIWNCTLVQGPGSALLFCSALC